MEKIKVTIVDFSGGGDGITALYIGNELETYGDYYHNKIDEWIDGFISGLQHLLGDDNVEQDFIRLHEDHPLVYDTSELGEGAPDKLSDIDVNKRIK